MFGTLLSYEIRSRARAVARVLEIIVAAIVVSLVVVALNIPVLSDSALRITYILCCGIPAGFVIAGMIDYWKTLYGQRGYFMMSLPVSGSSILWAKITRICLESFVGLAFAVGGIVATAAEDASRKGMSLAQYTADIRGVLAVFPTSMLVALAVAQVISTLAVVVQACAVMTIGAEGRFNHMGFGAPMIGFIILYFVNQVIGVVGTLFLPLSINLRTGRLSADIMWTSFLSMTSDTPPEVVGLGSFILGPLFAIVMAIWASRSIEKHTSLR